MSGNHLYFDILIYPSLILLLVMLILIRKKNKEMLNSVKKANTLETELNEEKNKLSQMIERIGEGIAIVDENEIFLFANRSAEEIFEVPAGTLVGRSVKEFLNEEDYKRIQSQTENRKKGETNRYELNIVTGEGNTRIIEITGSPNYDPKGNYKSSYGVFRDITEIKQAQNKIKESEELFKALLNNAPLPIFYKDINGKYIGCNEEFEKFMGLPESEIVGRTVYDIAPKELADLYKEKDTELFKKGGTQIYEWKAKTKDGSVRNIIYHKAAMYDYLGNTTGLIGAIVDVTDIKRYEKILEIKQSELERSNRDLEQFSYTVSHDLQEPLRMVASFTGLLKSKYLESLPGDALKYIDFTVDGAKRMQEMIHGLLSYSRISTQANPFEITDLKEPIDTALKNLSLKIRESSAVINVKINGLPKVYADNSQLSSVFLNLISNAIKFRKPDGEIIIDISAAENENGLVEITVQDNGIGIDKKHFENIFLIFHRLHSQDKYPGTGIGLSVCKKIIERHGGTIRVESEQGKGTTFYFTLRSGDK